MKPLSVFLRLPKNHSAKQKDGAAGELEGSEAAARE